MEIVENENYKRRIQIPNVLIETRNLIQILEEIVDNKGECKIIIGDPNEKQRKYLSGLDDIKANKQVVVGLMIIELEKLSLTMGKQGAVILYEDEASVTAEILERHLRTFQPWYNFFFLPWFAPAFVAALSAVIITDITGILSIDVPNYFYAYAIPSQIIVIGIPILLMRSKVYYLTRENFWQRNRDRIFTATISTVLGGLAVWYLTK